MVIINNLFCCFRRSICFNLYYILHFFHNQNLVYITIIAFYSIHKTAYSTSSFVIGKSNLFEYS